MGRNVNRSNEKFPGKFLVETVDKSTCVWYIGTMMNQTISLSSRQLALIADSAQHVVTHADEYDRPDVVAAQDLVNKLTRLDVDVAFTGRGQSIQLVVKHWSMGD